MSQLQAFRRLFGYAADGGRLVVAGYCMILVDALAQMLATAVFGIVLDRVHANPRSFLHDGWQGPLLAAVLIALVFLAVRTRPVNKLADFVVAALRAR